MTLVEDVNVERLESLARRRPEHARGQRFDQVDEDEPFDPSDAPPRQQQQQKLMAQGCFILLLMGVYLDGDGLAVPRRCRESDYLRL